MFLAHQKILVMFPAPPADQAQELYMQEHLQWFY